MRKKTVGIGLASLVGVVAAATLVWQLRPIPSVAIRIQAIDAVLANYQRKSKWNGTVLVAKGGEVLLEKGYGYRNASDGIANDPDTIYRIYSITKSITSTVVLQLIEQKHLSLQDRLSRFYPELQCADQITIEHLLYHTSGLFDYTQAETYTNNSESALLALLATKPLDFEAGHGWNYSNTNYCLLGHIIAKVSGKSYEDVVRTNIFEPLQMNDSGFNFEHLSRSKEAIGYRVLTDRTHFLSEVSAKSPSVVDSSGPFAAGAILSTAHDLFRFEQALLGNKLIQKSSLEKAWNGSAVSPNYGYGWQLQKRLFKPLEVSHSGGASGFRTSLSFIPKDGWCVILLDNHEGANVDFLKETIYDILGGKTVTEVREIPINPLELQKYVGIFGTADDKPQYLQTSVFDGRLAIQPFGQAPCTLIASSDGIFSQPEAKAVLRFSKDSKGMIQRLTVQQGWGSMKTKRSPSTWGIVGDATSGGWESSNDIALQEVPDQPGLWKGSNIPLHDGEIKFRFNQDWNINYGDDQQNLSLEPFGANIRVPGGQVDIVLDLRDGTNPNYQIIP
jgi:CubicO group peptidase (beta-lactamase class C family)